MTTKEWVLDQLLELGLLYDYSPTAERLRVYAAELERHGQGHLREAFNHAKRKCKKFPTLAELIEFLPSTSSGAGGFQPTGYDQREAQEFREWLRANYGGSLYDAIQGEAAKLRAEGKA
jgi:hypothetical protein